MLLSTYCVSDRTVQYQRYRIIAGFACAEDWIDDHATIARQRHLLMNINAEINFNKNYFSHSKVSQSGAVCLVLFAAWHAALV